MLYKYSTHGTVPEYVKTAATISKEDIQSLPSASFADPDREYPIHSKAATWLSALKMYNNDVSDKCAETIVKAAEFWGLDTELLKIASNVKVANARPTLDDTDFAIIVKSSGATIERRLPITDPESVKEAAKAINDMSSIYPLNIRKEAAKRILKAACDRKVALEELSKLQKTAGLGIAESAKVVQNLKYREKLASRTGAFDELVAEISKEEVLRGDLQEKTASALDQFDREHKLYRFYGNIPTPEDVCFGTTLLDLEKKASRLTLRDGTPFDSTKLENTSVTKFAALGSDFMDSISDGSGNVDIEAFEAIAPTLPLDDTSILKKVM